jgi:hypothetical protein
MQAHRLMVLVLSALSSVACQGPAWRGAVVAHGSTAEVMREGKTEGRVSLSTLQGDAELVSLGAMEGLRGEFIGLEGSVWISRVGALGAISTQGSPASKDRACFSLAARVTAWESIPITREFALAELEDYVWELGRLRGFRKLDAFPFRIEGPFRDLRLHVANGACPLREPASAARRWIPEGSGSVLGFYSQHGGGLLTHPGQRTHLHVRTYAPESLVGHIEELRVAPGATLLLPKDAP